MTHVMILLFHNFLALTVIAGLLVWIYRLKFELRKTLKRAETDSLTELYNRRTVKQRLTEEVDRAVRYGHGLQVLFIDLDNFKTVNDTHGHREGDSVLRQVAHHLKQLVRPSDVLGRYGGDEFLLILPETSAESARIVAEKVGRAIRNIQIKDGSIGISASIGIKGFNAQFPTADLIAQADEAMYAAKAEGEMGIHVLD